MPGCIPCQLHTGDMPIILDFYANDKLCNVPILQIVQYGTTQTRDTMCKCFRNLIIACGMFTESYKLLSTKSVPNPNYTITPIS